MRHPQPQPGILDISPYVPGQSKLSSGRQPIKLSSNESPLGASPAAIAAYRSAADQLERYPDGQAVALREAIAHVHNLQANQIVCGTGSDELLSLLAMAYLGPGDEAIYSQHGFLVYRIAILANGATPVVAPEKDLTTDIDAILERVTDKTRMVFIANPNNPTGTVIPATEIERLRAGLPADVILVLDGAYAEYVTGSDYTDGAKLVEQTTNTVMTRTFSKIHGLAALRLGWAYAPPAIADVLNRIRGPFNVSSAALAAGTAAIQDQEHVTRAIRHNTAWLPVLTEKLSELGLRVTPSVANFLLIHLPEDGRRTAGDLDEDLKSKSILLRRVTSYGLPNALRMTIGTDDENNAVIEAVTQFMTSTNSKAVAQTGHAAE